ARVERRVGAVLREPARRVRAAVLADGVLARGGERARVGRGDQVAPGLPEVPGVDCVGGGGEQDDGHDGAEARARAALVALVVASDDHSHRNSPFPVSVSDSSLNSGMVSWLAADTVTTTCVPGGWLLQGWAPDGVMLIVALAMSELLSTPL